MKILLAMLLLVSVAHADDYLFAEVGAYKNLGSNDWVGDYPIRFTAGYEWAEGNLYVRAEASHVSNVESGPPFNGRTETYRDLAGVTVGWRFRTRYRD